MGVAAFLQGGASSIAGEYDALFWLVNLNAVFFTILIFALIIVLSVRYRRGNRVDRSRAPQHNVPIELTWTIIPLGIALGIFAWATVLYFRFARMPANALDIHVVGKQWMWKMQHPSGRWENNELHVPLGRPIMLTMTSEDVIHSFYVPAFRLKQDVIPGQFTKMWFKPTKPGAYHIFCAEFCGTLHSTMVGTVYVVEPAEYERWLSESDVRESVAAEGARLFRRHGCSGCHGGNGSIRAPLLEGKWGRQVPVQVAKMGQALADTPATTVPFDTRYVHDSIVLPEKEIAAGYKPIMPTYKGRLSEEEILKLVAYIRSMQGGQGAGGGDNRADYSGSLGAGDYKARTGFVPERLPSPTGGQGAATGSGSTGMGRSTTGAGATSGGITGDNRTPQARSGRDATNPDPQ